MRSRSQVLLEADAVGMAGLKGKHDPGRTAVRHGHERGSVTLGGRRVAVSRPRVRAADGSGELPVPTCGRFAGTEILGAMAVERMLAGLPTRRYPVALQPVAEQESAAAMSMSMSAVSRKFVAMTETALAELLAADGLLRRPLVHLLNESQVHLRKALVNEFNPLAAPLVVGFLLFSAVALLRRRSLGKRANVVWRQLGYRRLALTPEAWSRFMIVPAVFGLVLAAIVGLNSTYFFGPPGGP